MNIDNLNGQKSHRIQKDETSDPNRWTEKLMIKFKIDTSAPISVMPRKLYKHLPSKTKIIKISVSTNIPILVIVKAKMLKLQYNLFRQT